MPDAVRILRRIVKMPAREITGRLSERLSAEAERRGFPAQPPALPVQNFKHFLKGEACRRFYPSATAASRVLVKEQFPKWIEIAIEEAESICRHEFQLLSLDRVALGPSIDWRQDPYSGARWETKFWADYNPVDDAQGRDLKVIHELNRHQHLPRLAVAYFWTGEERYATEAIAQMQSWIEQNPPGYGINWYSSLELAIRSIAWMWTMFLLLDADAFSDETANRIGASLFAQMEHVARHLSRFTSPNTHLIGEAAALYVAGVVFNIPDWARTGGDILNEEIHKQIFDGSVYGELSSWYHCYTIDFYLQAVTLARHNRCALSPQTEATLERMIEFLMHLRRPTGTLPLLGDDDGGHAFPVGHVDYRRYDDAIATGALLFHRADFRNQAAALSQSALWMLGPRVYDTWREMPSSAPDRAGVFHPAAGYAVQRSGWEPDASHVVFDCGGLGILNGGHAHADSLAITLSSRGRAILIDPGTFVYNCQPEWRSYFRSTTAHNTATVDGQDQIAGAGTFAWKSRMKARGAVQSIRSHRRVLEWLEGEHEAYAHHSVVHRRSIVQIPGEYFIVLDRFAGLGHHRFDLHYHLNPAIDPQLGRNELRGCEFLLAMHATSPLNCSMHIGEKNPTLGWASNGYGEIHPIPALRASLEQNLTCATAAVITIMSIGPNRRQVQPSVLHTGWGLAVTVEDDTGVSDLITFAPDGNWIQTGALKGHGEFFWLRTQGGVLQDAFSVRATRFDYDGLNLLEEELCAPSAAF